MNPSDREIIISIVSKAFKQNPRAVAMMKKKNPSRSVRLMTEYAFTLVEKFNGIYLSKDKTTVLFYYKKSQYKRGLMDYLRYGKMFLPGHPVLSAIPHPEAGEIYCQSAPRL